MVKLKMKGNNTDWYWNQKNNTDCYWSSPGLDKCYYYWQEQSNKKVILELKSFNWPVRNWLYFIRKRFQIMIWKGCWLHIQPLIVWAQCLRFFAVMPKQVVASIFIKYAATDGGPRSRVCSRLTLCLAPIDTYLQSHL